MKSIRKTIRNMRRKSRKLAQRLSESVFGEIGGAEFLLLLKLISKNEAYDRWTELVIRKGILPGSTCIDVGCHRGYILDQMIRHVPGGEFIAFEPVPELYEELKRKYTSPNIHIHNIALSDKKGEAVFCQVVTDPAYSGFLRRDGLPAGNQVVEIVVTTDTLENIFAEEQPRDLSFMKVDVEGSEYQVLKGSRRLIKQYAPVIVFEFGIGAADIYGTRPSDLYGLLVDECGLRISLLPHWLRQKASLSLEQFEEEFSSRRNYFFVAHP